MKTNFKSTVDYAVKMGWAQRPTAPPMTEAEMDAVLENRDLPVETAERERLAYSKARAADISTASPCGEVAPTTDPTGRITNKKL
jgi:hypothetical protein